MSQFENLRQLPVSQWFQKNATVYKQVVQRIPHRRLRFRKLKRAQTMQSTKKHPDLLLLRTTRGDKKRIQQKLIRHGPGQ